MAGAGTIVIEPAAALRGTLRVPGDKSISHRYALIASLAHGVSVIENYAPGADCRSTLECLKGLGVRIERAHADTKDGVEAPLQGRLTTTDTDVGDLRGSPLREASRSLAHHRSLLPPRVVIHGAGPDALRTPLGPLDCGNSGTTMRLLAGVVAGRPFETTLIGDASLSRRPMRRVADPLVRMGAAVELSDHGSPPMRVSGGRLAATTFTPATPSAQVKSAVLLAGLQADGITVVDEPVPTRDHTERALEQFGATVERSGRTIRLGGGQRLNSARVRVPGDLSSAAFALTAAAALPGSSIQVGEVGLNPSRVHLLEVLERWGAHVDTELTGSEHEPQGTITLEAHTLGALQIGPDEVPAVIDELPALAAAAALRGELRVTGASELRVKESDRIAALVDGLQALGADATELADGFIVRGRPLRGGVVHACGDHRLAMAFAVAALGAQGPTTIHGADAVAVSYPSFFDALDQLRA